MNEREQLKSAIETHIAAAEAGNQSQVRLDRVGEYLRMVEDETADLQARNQAEIAARRRRLINTRVRPLPTEKLTRLQAKKGKLTSSQNAYKHSFRSG